MTDTQKTLKAPDPFMLCTLFYGIYAAGMIMQFAPQTFVIGTIGMLVAIVLVYTQRDRHDGTIYQSHIQWLIRTFWIGGGVYLPVLTLVSGAFLYWQMDYTFLQGVMTDQRTPTADEVDKLFWDTNGQMITITGYCTLVPVALWWIWRCGKGYQHLKRRQPVPDVMSWI